MQDPNFVLRQLSLPVESAARKLSRHRPLSIDELAEVRDTLRRTSKAVQEIHDYLAKQES